MNLLRIFPVVSVLLLATTAWSNSTNCSNSTGSVKYQLDVPVFGNAPADPSLRKPTENWIKTSVSGDVQKLPAGAYIFDKASENIIEKYADSRHFSGWSVYSIKATEVPEGDRKPAVEFLICTNKWARPF